MFTVEVKQQYNNNNSNTESLPSTLAPHDQIMSYLPLIGPKIGFQAVVPLMDYLNATSQICLLLKVTYCDSGPSIWLFQHIDNLPLMD